MWASDYPSTGSPAHLDCSRLQCIALLTSLRKGSRPPTDHAGPPGWQADRNGGTGAKADETREQIIGLYHRAWAHSDATIGALALDAIGQVPWWPEERREVTLHRILVHMIAETDRHAGQADIVRELIDGATGLRQDNGNLAPGDRTWWAEYRNRLEVAAREAGAQ